MIKKGLYFALGVFAVITLTVVYYKFNPAKYGLFPKCPFYLITGLNCPGCGSQRAFYCLLHGNFAAALHYNLLLVLSIPFLGIHLYYKIRSALLKKDFRWAVIYHPLTPKIIFAIVVVFWITRNIPAYPFNILAANH
jgi:hypothetical protein